MLLLTVTHFYEAHGGGIERVAGHINRAVQRAGDECLWAASDEDALPPDIPAIGLRCFNPTERLSGLPMPIPGPAATLALWRAVRASDAVIIHDALYATSIIAMIAARALGKPVVLIQHIAGIPFRNPLLQGAMQLANRIVTRPMLAAATQAVFISTTVRDAFSGLRTRRPPALLFNGVDTAIFHPDGGASRAAVRAALDLSSGTRLVLFAGRFVEKKGISVLRVLAGLRPDLHFLLAGRGPLAPDAWGLPNVQVMSDRSGASLAELYRAADLLLLPSVGEGYPLVVQEAMACGLPVICGEESASADPDARRWLTGVPVDLSDPDGTAARLSIAIDRMGPPDRAATADYAARAYSWRRMSAALVAFAAPSAA